MATRHYIEPVSFVSGEAARTLAATGHAIMLGRPDVAFSAARVHERSDSGIRHCATMPWTPASAGLPGAGGPLGEIVAAMSRDRADFAGIDVGRPAVAGVVNVTPDSFSDGGDHSDPARAIAAGERMLGEGADIIDVGGESTRPGAGTVPEEEEIRRIIPVVRALSGIGCVVSVDTRKARVMQAAIENGATIINDVSALTHDPDSLAVIARSGASVVLMHIRGEPATMQDSPTYDHVLTEVFDKLEARVAACVEAGIGLNRIAVDPGIGFGKTSDHNLRLVQGLGMFQALGCVVMLGVSRKGFIGRLGKAEAPKDRLPGSLSLGIAGVQRGAQLLRVHDVGETRQALALWEAVNSSARSMDRTG